MEPEKVLWLSGVFGWVSQDQDATGHYCVSPASPMCLRCHLAGRLLKGVPRWARAPLFKLVRDLQGTYIFHCCGEAAGSPGIFPNKPDGLRQPSGGADPQRTSFMSVLCRRSSCFYICIYQLSTWVSVDGPTGFETRACLQVLILMFLPGMARS